MGGGDAGSSAATGLVQQLRIKRIANVSAAIVCLSSIKNDLSIIACCFATVEV